MRQSAALGVLFALIAATSQAQDPAATPAPTPEGGRSGAPIAQFIAGPFIVTPTFRIGTLAVDTNVLYQRERKADFVASAGPGLDIELPFLDHWKFDVKGSSQYFYFHRTAELRRWTGGGTAALHWATTGTRASLSTGSSREFARPSFEVDTRVATRQVTVIGLLERDLGRLTLALSSSWAQNKVDPGQEFRGADLATSLTTTRYGVGPELRFRLTPISSLLIESSFDRSHLPNAEARDFDAQSLGVGLLTSGFFKGQVTAGIRRNQLRGGGASKSQPYLRGGLAQKLGRRVQLRETYTHESAVSAFSVDGNLPTFERRAITLEMTIELTKRLDMRLSGSRDKFKSDGFVRVILDDGSLGAALRDDVAYVGTADMGFRLGRARIALFGSYTTRDSLYFADFGIEGLQAGARVEYAPF